MGFAATGTKSLSTPKTRNADSVALTTSVVGGSVTGGSAIGNGTAAMKLTQTITGFRSRTETGATTFNYANCSVAGYEIGDVASLLAQAL
jgi:hypothetical protein